MMVDNWYEVNDLQALKHDLNLDDIGTASDPETTLRRLQNSINLVSLEESLEIARAEAARASLEMQEQNRTIGSNFSDAVVCSNVLSILLQLFRLLYQVQNIF